MFVKSNFVFAFSPFLVNGFEVQEADLIFTLPAISPSSASLAFASKKSKEVFGLLLFSQKSSALLFAFCPIAPPTSSEVSLPVEIVSSLVSRRAILTKQQLCHEPRLHVCLLDRLQDGLLNKLCSEAECFQSARHQTAVLGLSLLVSSSLGGVRRPAIRLRRKIISALIRYSYLPP